MRIKSEEYEIGLNEDELFQMCVWARDSLISAVKSHWINYPDTWEEKEKFRIDFIKDVSIKTNNNYFFEETMNKCYKIIEDHLSKLEKTN